MRARITILCWGAVALALLGLAGSAAAQFRPALEFRSLNTSFYEISIQKNGRLDLALSSKNVVCTNVSPLVWFAGERSPDPMEIDGRYSERFVVRDELGTGQGMLLRKDETEWRLHAYPRQPFLVVQVAYVNDGRKPVTIHKLIPWAVGEARNSTVSLGEGTQHAAVLTNSPGTNPRISTTDQNYDNVTAIYNPTTGQSLIAGFITATRADTRITLARSKPKLTEFDQMRAECIYDPPVTLAPGERLQSEVLYISVGERDALEGLERYARALAVANQIDVLDLSRSFGVQAGEPGEAPGKEAVLATLDFVSETLAPYGWNRMTIPEGWERVRGDWTPDRARFPDGMRALTDEIHEHGMRASLSWSPFLVDSESELARSHPDWLVPRQSDSADASGTSLLILNVARQDVYDHLRAEANRIRTDWGFDGVEGVEIGPLYELASSATEGLTHVEVVHRGLQALREGLGTDAALGIAEPTLLAGFYTDDVEILAGDQYPLTPASPLHSISAHAANAGFTGHLWRPRIHMDRSIDSYFGETRAGSGEEGWLAVATYHALLGGVLQIDASASSFGPERLEVLRRLAPAWDRPARPLDLFVGRPPEVLLLPVDKPGVGNWSVLGLFNWREDETKETAIAFPLLGLEREAYFTVYDFWEERYYGTARHSLTIAIPPGSVRLIGLRKFRDRPMFLASNSHFTQGAADHNSIQWDRFENRMHGAFDGVAGMTYKLTYLIPTPYTLTSIDVSVGDPRVTQDDRLLILEFECESSGPVEWLLEFEN